MTPAEFARTIYLGDRACKAIQIDGWEQRFVLQVDQISRVRGLQWDYYSAEDIPDGRIVFSGVRGVRFDPPGPIPNDLINELSVSASTSGFCFRLSVDAVDESGKHVEVTIEVEADQIHLEDPRRPGEIITT